MAKPVSGSDGTVGRASIAADPALFVNASKRSVTIAGHATSIRIESPFWDALLVEARARALPINAVIAQIDAARLLADTPPNLASAIRLWVFHQHRHSREVPTSYT